MTRIKFLLVLILASSFKTYSQHSSIFHKIEIYKIAHDEKAFDVIRLNINSAGKIRRKGNRNENITNLKSFDQSIQKMFSPPNANISVMHDQVSKNIIKRQTKKNSKSIYVTVTFLSDYLFQNKSPNATQYTYRETNLTTSQKDYDFFKYFDSESIETLERSLK